MMLSDDGVSLMTEYDALTLIPSVVFIYVKLNKLPKDGNQVAGYKSPQYGDISRWSTGSLFQYEMSLKGWRISNMK